MYIFLEEWIKVTQHDITRIEIGKRHYYEYNGVRIKKNTPTKYFCSICGKSVERKFFYTKNFDLRCEACKMKQTKIDKYGDENAFNFGSNEFRFIIKEKYGVENISQTEQQKQNLRNNKKAPLFGSEKYFQLMNQRYGVDYPLQSKQIRNKIENTNFTRYGSKNPSNSNLIKKIKNEKFLKKIDEKLKQENIIRLFNNQEYLGTKTLHSFQCQQCDSKFEAYLRNGILPKCYTCNKKQITSQHENELSNWLEENNIPHIKNERNKIKPYELDVYTPTHNIAIEIDGLYWHSDIYKDKNYHINKTRDCEKQGIKLIHIFEDEWLYKQDIVKARLKNIFGLNSDRVGARKTTIKEIDSKTKNKFLNKYHLQGSDKSNVKLGSFYQDELVGVMTFSKPRLFMNQKNKNNTTWELSRFATISDTYTPGLASKMLTYFKNNYDWSEIYSYADRRWSQGNLYKSIGFEFEYDTKPNYWYWKNQPIRFHRYNFRKQNLKSFSNYSKEKTEIEIMDEAGWYRIYDCGNKKYMTTKTLK